MYFPCSGGLLYKTCSYKFCKIHRKHLSGRLSFLTKTAEIQAGALLKKRLRHRCFPVSLTKFLRTSTLENTSWQVPL